MVVRIAILTSIFSVLMHSIFVDYRVPELVIVLSSIFLLNFIGFFQKFLIQKLGLRYQLDCFTDCVFSHS